MAQHPINHRNPGQVAGLTQLALALKPIPIKHRLNSLQHAPAFGVDRSLISVIMPRLQSVIAVRFLTAENWFIIYPTRAKIVNFWHCINSSHLGAHHQSNLFASYLNII